MDTRFSIKVSAAGWPALLAVLPGKLFLGLSHKTLILYVRVPGVGYPTPAENQQNNRVGLIVPLCSGEGWLIHRPL